MTFFTTISVRILDMKLLVFYVCLAIYLFIVVEGSVHFLDWIGILLINILINSILKVNVGIFLPKPRRARI